MRYVIEFRASEALMGATDAPRPHSMTLCCEQFVQLTYHELRVGPDGDCIAYYDEHTDAWRQRDHEHLSWSDIVITCPEESTR
jgi:hypothetical protein